MNDLISRAAAIEALSTPCDKRYRHGVWETCLDNIETAIRNIPAVDAAPVVHGRWTEEETSENTIDEWQSAKCTNCGKYHTTPYLYYFSDYKFCPNCGAKMDGERRDSERRDSDGMDA